MAQARVTVRRWGSDLAAIIPPKTLRAEGLKEGDEVILEIHKAGALRDSLGRFKREPLHAQKIKDAIRRDDGE